MLFREITSLQVKMANMEARLAELSRPSQSSAVITPSLATSTMIDGECQTTLEGSGKGLGRSRCSYGGSVSSVELRNLYTNLGGSAQKPKRISQSFFPKVFIV